MKKCYTDEQIIGFIKQAAAGTPVTRNWDTHETGRQGLSEILCVRHTIGQRSL